MLKNQFPFKNRAAAAVVFALAKQCRCFLFPYARYLMINPHAFSHIQFFSLSPFLYIPFYHSPEITKTIGRRCPQGWSQEGLVGPQRNQ